MVTLRAVLATALLICSPSQIAAQTVTLSDTNGVPLLEGPLSSGNAQVIELDSKYGPVVVNAPALTCEGDCPTDEDGTQSLTITGEPWLIENLLAIHVEAFANRNGIPFTKIENRYELGGQDPIAITLNHDSSTHSIDALINNETDIALTFRPVTPLEAEQLQPEIYGKVRPPLRSQIVAFDALAPITSPVNAIDTLRDVAIFEILDEKAKNWRDVGGPNLDIQLAFDHNDQWSREIIEQFGLMSPTPMSDVIDEGTVLNDGAFGIVPFSAAHRSKVLNIMGPCGFGTKLHRRSVKALDYPLTLPIMAYFPPRPIPPIAASLFSFMTSPSGHLVTQRAGFFDPSVEEIPANLQGERLLTAIQTVKTVDDLTLAQSMASLMTQTNRLSTTFRFAAGSTDLDMVSKAHLQALATDLQNGRYLGRTLYLVGFSDGAGPSNINLNLSIERAETVLKSLRAFIPEEDRTRHRIETRGFGEILPIDCDDQIIGRNVNRRVEIWID